MPRDFSEEARLDLSALAVRCRDDRRERDMAKLLRLCRPMIGAAVRRFGPSGVDHEDLAQEARMAIVRALETFDPLAGSFSSYAARHAHFAVQSYSTFNSGLVSLPNSTGAKWLAQVAPRLFREHAARNPMLTSRQICELVAADGRTSNSRCRNLTADDVEAAMNRRRLGKPIEGEGDEHQSPALLFDENQDPDEGVMAERLRAIVAAALAELPPRTAEMIRARYLTGDFVSLDAIALDHGVSRERVRRIIEAGMAHLKRVLAAHGVQAEGLFG